MNELAIEQIMHELEMFARYDIVRTLVFMKFRDEENVVYISMMDSRDEAARGVTSRLFGGYMHFCHQKGWSEKKWYKKCEKFSYFLDDALMSQINVDTESLQAEADVENFNVFSAYMNDIINSNKKAFAKARKVLV